MKRRHPKYTFDAHAKAVYAYNEFITVLAIAMLVPCLMVLYNKYSKGLHLPTITAQFIDALAWLPVMALVATIGFGLLKGLIIYLVHAISVFTAFHIWRKRHRYLTVRYIKRFALQAVETEHDQTFKAKTKTQCKV